MDFVTSTEIEGRPVTKERDDLQSTPVAIVNETFARRFFGDRDAIGKHVKPGVGNGYEKEPNREIVGVVGDVHTGALRDAPAAEV